MCKPYVLGIDIGGTNTVFGMADTEAYPTFYHKHSCR